MKNIIVLFGIIDYTIGLFLPWGPTGTTLESGFNNEASPGLVGFLPVILALIFAFKSSKKAGFYTIFSGIIMLLFSVLVIFQTSKLPGNDYLAQKFGVYLMILGAVVVIYSSLQKRKILNNTSEIE